MAQFFDLEAACNDSEGSVDPWQTPEYDSLTAMDEDVGTASGASRESGSQTIPIATVMDTTTSNPVNVTTTSPSRAFRISARRLALTFPQNATTKDVCMERILEKWGQCIKWAVVTQESHEDGNPHLHIAIVFSRKKNFKRSDFADFIGAAHGNYQVMKNELDWLKYITKSDKHPVLHKIDIEVIYLLYFSEHDGGVNTE